MSWNAEIVAWQQFCRAAGLTAGTIETRRHYLRHLARAHADRDPWLLTTDDLVEFVGRDGWSPQTRRCARAAVRSLYSWARTTGRLTVDPALDLPKVRAPQGMPRPIPRAEFAQSVARADHRVRLMLCLGRFAGLRRAEIAGVHTEHVDGDVLRVLGKGSKVRHVPLHPEIAGQLAALPAGWAFPSATYPGRPLTPAHVGVLMRRVLPPGWTPHTLRHRAGTDWYQVERDLIAVQRLLGHASLDTTRIYVDVVEDSMRRAVLGVA